MEPVAVVRAEIAGNPGDYDGDKAPYGETAARMADRDRSPGRGRCPVLGPYYRDLTGDGRDELTLGLRLLPGSTTAVRVCTVEKQRLVKVMGWEDALSVPRRAGRRLITGMCGALAALLGVLVHVQVTNQTVGPRDLALQRAGGGHGVVPGRGLAQAGRRGRSPGAAGAAAGPGARGGPRHDGRRAPRAPHDVGGGPGRRRARLAVAVDYAQQARTIEAPGRAILWSSGLAIGATLLWARSR